MPGHVSTLSVECRTCPVRELHCGDCMVPVLLGLTAPERVDRSALDHDERSAVTRLVRAGLVDAEEASRVRVSLAPTAEASRGGGAGGRAVG
ncbi:hypothetical protein ACK8HX_03055 [Oryzobacter sp. R7]|uniref:hypothetical protein n=1 Tax=Oryzobacter faecalis TaxID=3388656 RepID=UPI00398D4A93